MSTPLWIAVGVAAYVALMLFVVALLAIARRSDESTDRAAARLLPPWSLATTARPRRRGAPVEASGRWLAQRTADAQHALDAERMAVVLRDPADARSWVVEACAGVGELCGTVLPGDSAAQARASAAAALLAAEAGDWARWSVAAAGVVVEGEVVGVAAAATRRDRGLTPHDRELLERFASLLAGHIAGQAERAGTSGPT